MEERGEREGEGSWARHGMKSARGAIPTATVNLTPSETRAAHARVQWMGWREKELLGEFMQPQTHQST